MDIFKLFFEHDLRLDNTAERATDRKPDTKGSIEEFMKPIPTYSRFYLTGTRLESEIFGLNRLDRYGEILDKLDQVLDEYFFHCGPHTERTLGALMEDAEVGFPILISRKYTIDIEPDNLMLNDDSNVAHIKEDLRKVLEQDYLLLYKEKAHDGYDLHLFSRENIYEDLFYPFREMVDDDFRFFSINSKRIQSERQFYFETWTLEKPPHGAEEVFPETVI